MPQMGSLLSLSIVSVYTICRLLQANVDGKTSSWSGFWRYTKMVSCHLISNGILLTSVPEKKLAITLKTLLVLEAMAKAVFIVRGNLLEEGAPL